ncbi:hypothetical protein LIER_06429 [Lithospermum erythrorhizon]|uniref:Uncharacterized protein n=1 Tax=Lithospermum erythrorhizon TaxID=34254 RepID=A0AAV3P4U3_LITER
MGFPVFYLSEVYGATLYGDRRDAEQVKGGNFPEPMAVEEFNCCLDELDWVHSVKLKGGSIWAYKKRDKDPWYWKNILKVRPLVKQRLQVSMGNGKHVSFWHDPWSELGVIWDYLGDNEK